eukprot:scaffold285423_cov11-Prasinocladus_malaysianus.AAC.1
MLSSLVSLHPFVPWLASERRTGEMKWLGRANRRTSPVKQNPGWMKPREVTSFSVGLSCMPYCSG